MMGTISTHRAYLAIADRVQYKDIQQLIDFTS